MAENTNISWCDATFNPWVGCVKVSDGCRECYAEAFMTRKGRWANTWGPAQATERIKTSDSNWRKPLAWNKQAAKEGKRMKVFCASLADVFERNDKLIDWRWDLWELTKATPNLDWLLLTKRPENVLDMTPHFWHKPEWHGYTGWPENVWIGTTTENQEQAEKRIPELLRIPARVRFLSCEPLLGTVDLSKPGMLTNPSPKWIAAHRNELKTDLNGIEYVGCMPVERLIHWVIAGGESGPSARPMHPDWARGLRDQCQAAGVAFHFKQFGEWVHESQIQEWHIERALGSKRMMAGDGYQYIQVGKHSAGRLLDGRTWDEFPEVNQ